MTTDNQKVMVACVCKFAASHDRVFYKPNIKKYRFLACLIVCLRGEKNMAKRYVHHCVGIFNASLSVCVSVCVCR